jgi:anti-sigma B factor antagonist
MSGDDQIQISIRDGVTVVCLGPDFESLYESELVKLQSVRELADTASPPVMIIDLSNIKYFGSAFMGFLFAIANRLIQRGDGRLGLCNLAPFARMVLETTKSNTIIGLFESQDDAVSALTSASD